MGGLSAAPPPRRVYADTSVFGGCFDPEFATASLAFVAQVRAGRFRLVVSTLVVTELAGAPPRVQAVLEESLAQAELVMPEAGAVALQAAYLDRGIVGPRYTDDALHVAVATFYGCQVLVSWNFRHIVHLNKIRQYNAINRQQGYGMIAIHSPAEVLHDG